MCSTVYENCHANSNLSEYYDSARATARSRGSVSTSGITVHAFRFIFMIFGAPLQRHSNAEN